MKNDNLVVIEKEEEVSLITLNDESSFNALSEDLLNKLFLVLQQADEDDSTNVIIIKGFGRGFSAGHNLKEVQQNQDESFYRTLLNISKKVMSILPKLKKPVIAQVHGVATAAGCQLVAACDLSLIHI